MASKSSHTTVDHDQIRRWAEARGGHPTSVKGTAEGEEAGLLRIDFEENGLSDKLDPISWDEFFRKFDEKNLAFIYQDHKSDGEESTFFKFVDRDSVQLDEPGDESGVARQGYGAGNDPVAVQCLNEIMNAHLKLLDAYDDAIRDIDDENIVSMLKEQCGMHEEHILDLESVVLGMGGQPIVLGEAGESTGTHATH